MSEVAFTIFTLLIATSIGCAIARIWSGPTVADRLNAADVIALCCIGLAVAHGWHRHDAIWLDVAMVAGLVLFVGTSAVSLFLDPEHLSQEEDD
jgi:multicomponent Na+:H+ antiporter subunit F